MASRRLLVGVVAAAVVGQCLCATTLLEWIEELGGAVGPWAPKADVNIPGRGLFATQDIPKGSVIAQVPFGVVMAGFSTHEGPLAEIADQFGLDDTTRLTLTLMVERSFGKDSQWYPYLRTLPRKFELPMFYTDDDLEQLQDTLARSVVLRSKEQVESSFQWFNAEVAATNREVFPASEFTLKNWKWATAVLHSRAHRLESPDSSQPPMVALIPVFDFLNSYSGIARSPNVVASAEELELRTSRDVWEGDELVVEYADAPCLDFVVHYGFCPGADSAMPEPRDRAGISFGFTSATIRDAGTAIVHRVFVGMEFGNHFLTLDQCIPPSLAAALRLDHMNAVELANFTRWARDSIPKDWPSYHMSQALVDDGNPDGPAAEAQRVMAETFDAIGARLLSSDVEALPDDDAIRGAAAEYLRIHASLYPTTAEEDEAELEQHGTTSRRGQIVSLRLREKRIVQGCVDSLTDGLVVEVGLADGEVINDDIVDAEP